MTKTREWPVRVMYMLIAAALAISLIITAAPAQKVSGACTADVCAEWEIVSTPTTEGWVLAPESYIIDYAVASGGEVDYSIVYGWNYEAEEEPEEGSWLLKSEDHAATWDNITKGVKKEISKVLDLDSEDDVDPDMYDLLRVATDGEEKDFLAVALDIVDIDEIHVFISVDGGETFKDADEVKDVVYFDDPDDISLLVVSYENGDGDREIAIGGVDNLGAAALFRCTVEGDNPEDWEDATDYKGWDDEGDFTSNIVTWIIFSPNWETDKTILVTTIDDYDNTWTTVAHGDVHLQSGSWGTSPGWNEKSTLGIEAVLVKEDVDMPYFCPRGIAGITEPEDYNSKEPDDRVLWVWVNYYDSAYPFVPMCDIMRVDDDSADPVGPMGQIEDGELWLSNVDYQGTILEGEAIAGVLGTGTYDPIYGSPEDLFVKCCEGVQVYYNDGIRNMDICCERWHDACKPPTGRWVMAVSYVGEDKAYAVALMGEEYYEEGAWSWSFDDGETWNQLSLIDTYIDYLSDVAVSPDCNKTMLVSVNEDYWEYDEYISDPEQFEEDYCVILDPLGDNYYDVRWINCDSVWLHAVTLPDDEGPEYSGKWIRTWCGILEGYNDDEFPAEFTERGLLRLAPEETTGDNVFLVDRMSANVYWNDLETLACWDPIGSTAIDNIVDLAAQDFDTLFALDANGDVAMFDDDEWHEAVDSEVDYGWTIAVWGDDTTYILVGGCDGDVSYTDDFEAEEDVFTMLEDEDEKSVASDGYVTVAFDSYFDTNHTIFAAVADADDDGIGDKDDDNGIYLWEFGGEPEEWTKLAAEEYDYTGLVLDRPNPGNPRTSAETGGVLYASYVGLECDDECGDEDIDECWYTGVARCLTPIVEICCGAGGDEWNYLTWDLEDEWFDMAPDALKICGCLEADSNSKLFAIDDWYYDMEEGEEGTVWMFEDCYAKKGVELVSPDGVTVRVDDCGCCNAPFPIKWDRLCDACCYEIEFALDEEFTEIYHPYWILGPDDDDPYEKTFEWWCPDEPMTPSIWVGCWFDPEFTYYWRVRAVEAETCQDILSWWSEPLSFTVAPTAASGDIKLVSPEPGATGVAIKNVGFSWDLLAEADGFDWVLDNNADFSSPVEEKTDLTATAYGCTETLEYDTTYYWQVTAYNKGVEISTSSVGTFTTASAGQFCCPQCGLCFDTQEELKEHIDDMHPTQPVTPPWVWVVIAIGAVLVIVVIVLIFRTRRV